MRQILNFTQTLPTERIHSQPPASRNCFAISIWIKAWFTTRKFMDQIWCFVVQREQFCLCFYDVYLIENSLSYQNVNGSAPVCGNRSHSTPSTNERVLSVSWLAFALQQHLNRDVSSFIDCNASLQQMHRRMITIQVSSLVESGHMFMCSAIHRIWM